ncbi:GIY-YIG nuclease family protein [Anabaena sp. UHCC 0253]|nr:GIY-YIG nuclease family protein [Anabaena sp. UHCC 0204]MTJ56063.1 GIY-YIG nuclease family protein [Anabaena sp. UHCC 0253]
MECVNLPKFIGFSLVRRCKIGLSRNPQARLQNFIDNQPPCDIKILRTIYVEDMATVEKRLHQKFYHCNVKLTKSREWFDLNPLDFLAVNRAFDEYQDRNKLPVLKISFSLLGIAVLTMALLATQATPQRTQPQIKPVIEGMKSI